MRGFFGVVCALLALATGGCSLAFSPMIGNSGDLLIVWSLGGIPALFFGFLAWRLLKTQAPEETGK